MILTTLAAIVVLLALGLCEFVITVLSNVADWFGSKPTTRIVKCDDDHLDMNPLSTHRMNQHR